MLFHVREDVLTKVRTTSMLTNWTNRKHIHDGDAQTTASGRSLCVAATLKTGAALSVPGLSSLSNYLGGRMLVGQQGITECPSFLADRRPQSLVL